MLNKLVNGFKLIPKNVGAIIQSVEPTDGLFNVDIVLLPTQIRMKIIVSDDPSPLQLPIVDWFDDGTVANDLFLGLVSQHCPHLRSVSSGNVGSNSLI